MNLENFKIKSLNDAKTFAAELDNLIKKEKNNFEQIQKIIDSFFSNQSNFENYYNESLKIIKTVFRHTNLSSAVANHYFFLAVKIGIRYVIDENNDLSYIYLRMAYFTDTDISQRLQYLEKAREYAYGELQVVTHIISATIYSDIVYNQQEAYFHLKKAKEAIDTGDTGDDPFYMEVYFKANKSTIYLVDKKYKQSEIYANEVLEDINLKYDKAPPLYEYIYFGALINKTKSILNNKLKTLQEKTKAYDELVLYFNSIDKPYDRKVQLDIIEVMYNYEMKNYAKSYELSKKITLESVKDKINNEHLTLMSSLNLRKDNEVKKSIERFKNAIQEPLKNAVKLIKNSSILKLKEIEKEGEKYKALANQEKRLSTELNEQVKKSDALLLNVYPKQMLKELKKTSKIVPKYYDEATVLFADIKGFTVLSQQVSEEELIEVLNLIFTTFDELAEQHQVERIKTIGDCYMAVSGVPVPNAKHIENMVKFALAIQKEIPQINEQLKIDTNIQLRVGIDTGPVIAGVVGKKKYAFDIWGEAVDGAEQMEKNGEVGKVNVSEKVISSLADKTLIKKLL